MLRDSPLDSKPFTKEELVRLLSLSDEEEIQDLFRRAYEVKKQCVGTEVYLRGIIELSNLCEKNCYYCGIRRDNSKVERYTMSEAEILGAAEQAWQWGYGSVVLQSGEITSRHYALFIERLIREMQRLSGGELGITLSLGEQDRDTYQRWYDAGAQRYLLRIETSDRGLYSGLHPEDHSYDRRLDCLAMLKETGYYVGTGVMIGLPGQTMEQLAEDILFFKEIDADMIGMGPYIPHQDTPLGSAMEDWEAKKEGQLGLALRMIALSRIVLRDLNIAATTALQTLDASGRELGLKAGANIIMPNITDRRYRRGYQLYDNKPCLDENAALSRACLEVGIQSIGETIGYNKRGESPHYEARKTVRLLGEGVKKTGASEHDRG